MPPKRLHMDQWRKKYRPIQNPVEPTYGDAFLIHDDGYELVEKAIAETPNKVWTQYAYGGRTCICAGPPNDGGSAIACFITEVPWENQTIRTHDYET